MNLEAFTNQLKELAAENENLLTGSVKLVFEEGVIVLEGNDVHNNNIETDCTVTISLENINKIITGNVNVMDIMMSGEMQMEGDTSIVLQVGALLTA